MEAGVRMVDELDAVHRHAVDALEHLLEVGQLFLVDWELLRAEVRLELEHHVEDLHQRAPLVLARASVLLADFVQDRLGVRDVLLVQHVDQLVTEDLQVALHHLVADFLVPVQQQHAPIVYT